MQIILKIGGFPLNQTIKFCFSLSFSDSISRFQSPDPVSSFGHLIRIYVSVVERPTDSVSPPLTVIYSDKNQYDPGSLYRHSLLICSSCLMFSTTVAFRRSTRPKQSNLLVLQQYKNDWEQARIYAKAEQAVACPILTCALPILTASAHQASVQQAKDGQSLCEQRSGFRRAGTANVYSMLFHTPSVKCVYRVFCLPLPMHLFTKPSGHTQKKVRTRTSYKQP